MKLGFTRSSWSYPHETQSNSSQCEFFIWNYFITKSKGIFFALVEIELRLRKQATFVHSLSKKRYVLGIFQTKKQGYNHEKKFK